MTGDRHLAEDLLQEALARVAARWEAAAGGDPEPYVRRVLYTCAVDGWRRKRPHDQGEASDRRPRLQRLTNVSRRQPTPGWTC